MMFVQNTVAIDLHLHGAGQIPVVEFVYVMANFGTFLMRCSPLTSAQLTTIKRTAGSP